MMYDNDDEHAHFKSFAHSLELEIAKYGTKKEDLFNSQRSLFERLVCLEDDFRQTLLDSPHCDETYKAFISHICEDKRNLLAARPYYRERQTFFTSNIVGSFKTNDHLALQQFHGNYQFILFVMSCRKWPKNCKLASIAKAIKDLRTELITTNMPLAISRARIFYSRTPKSAMEYLDLIQTHTNVQETQNDNPTDSD